MKCISDVKILIQTVQTGKIFPTRRECTTCTMDTTRVIFIHIAVRKETKVMVLASKLKLCNIFWPLFTKLVLFLFD